MQYSGAGQQGPRKDTDSFIFSFLSQNDLLETNYFRIYLTDFHQLSR